MKASKATKVKGEELSLVQTQVVSGVAAVKADFGKRRIFLVDEIDLDAAFIFLLAFHEMDRSEGPIEVVVMSVGGYEPAGWAIYDAIQQARNQVVVLGTGVVASMAVPILLAGDVRVLTPECRVMVHNGTVEMGETIDQGLLISRSRELEKTNLRYKQVLVAKTKLTLREVTRACNADRSYTAAEALALGFVDQITTSKKAHHDGPQEKDRPAPPRRARAPRRRLRGR